MEKLSEEICLKCNNLFWAAEEDKICNDCIKEITLKYASRYIKKIEVCNSCKTVVMCKIGHNKWFKKGFFQCGGDDKQIHSWCSEECFKKLNK